MKSLEITVKFRTENAAFKDDGEFEVNRVLEEAKRIIKDPSGGQLLRDSNGNTVGYVTWDEV
jgi:hypothetical protein